MTNITQYIRSKGGHKKGLLMAVKRGKKVSIGWTLAHSQLDDFDSKHARALAMGRIMLNEAPPIPRSIAEDVKNFKKRSKKYFAGCKIKIVGEE